MLQSMGSQRIGHDWVTTTSAAISGHLVFHRLFSLHFQCFEDIKFTVKNDLNLIMYFLFIFYQGH